MSATRTTQIPEQKAEPFRGWVTPAREPTPQGKREPAGCEDSDELAAVAVLSTN